MHGHLCGVRFPEPAAHAAPGALPSEVGFAVVHLAENRVCRRTLQGIDYGQLHDHRAGGMMGIGTSIVLIAVGAILRFAVSVHTAHVNWHIVGDILMVAGAIGLVLSLIWMAMASRRETTTVVDRGGDRSAGY